MWNSIKGLFAGSAILEYAATFVAAIVALGSVAAVIFSAGKTSEKAKVRQEIIKDVEVRHEIDTSVAREPDPVGRLQQQWSRD